MALTRVRKETIDTTLTVTGQGESQKFNVTFHNRRQSEVAAQLNDDGKSVADTVLFMVKDWDADYPLTTEGLQEMEDDRPGMTMCLIEGFHEARKVHREKN